MCNFVAADSFTTAPAPLDRVRHALRSRPRPASWSSGQCEPAQPTATHLADYCPSPPIIVDAKFANKAEGAGAGNPAGSCAEERPRLYWFGGNWVKENSALDLDLRTFASDAAQGGMPLYPLAAQREFEKAGRRGVAANGLAGSGPLRGEE